MECPSCTFQNTPGTHNCVRCGTLLDLESVDFIPPRASSGRAARRARGARDAARFWIASGWSDIGRSLRIPESTSINWYQAWWLLVPGLPQIRTRTRGLRLLGFGILLVWTAIVAMAIGNAGTG
ncbi:MAG TPA: hypothetical protein VMT60_03960, partial [Candidatus Bathyarchaeia archaeon]|nr:hypothetical protein [Candidatus Bathyarchaeia archaeon]